MSIRKGTPDLFLFLSVSIRPPRMIVSWSRTETLAWASFSLVIGTSPTFWMVTLPSKLSIFWWMSITTRPSGLISGVTSRLTPICELLDRGIAAVGAAAVVAGGRVGP